MDVVDYEISLHIKNINDKIGTRELTGACIAISCKEWITSANKWTWEVGARGIGMAGTFGALVNVWINKKTSFIVMTWNSETRAGYKS